ncbi:hypothetical protein B0H13DRAFT_2568089 [Mycena leptocephala]|nr:hypothetical protein B0H13DRAFT_2568089 [Mycena leptocephala]
MNMSLRVHNSQEPVGATAKKMHDCAGYQRTGILGRGQAMMWGKFGAKKRTLAVGKRFGGQRAGRKFDPKGTANVSCVARFVPLGEPEKSCSDEVEVKALEVGSSEQFRSPLALSRPRDLAASHKVARNLARCERRRSVHRRTLTVSASSRGGGGDAGRRLGRWEIAGRLAACLAAMCAMETTAAGGAHSEGAARGARDVVERARRAAKAVIHSKWSRRHEGWARATAGVSAASGRRGGDGPKYERVRGMLRVRVEVDGGRLACHLARGVIMRGLGRGDLVLWMAENDVFFLLDAPEENKEAGKGMYQNRTIPTITDIHRRRGRGGTSHGRHMSWAKAFGFQRHISTALKVGNMGENIHVEGVRQRDRCGEAWWMVLSISEKRRRAGDSGNAKAATEIGLRGMRSSVKRQ